MLEAVAREAARRRGAHHIVGTQTFGITTGTLNCGPAAADQVTEGLLNTLEADKSLACSQLG